MIFLSIFVLIAGLTMVIKPDVWWHIAEAWKSYDATEPSDLYIKTTRVGGILGVVTGIAGMIASFL